MEEKPAYFKETLHNNLRRAPWHDYRSRCIYMVTFTKAAGCPVFSHVGFDESQRTFLRLNMSGQLIQAEINKTPYIQPKIKILNSVVMPDHLHILIFVTSTTEKHLGEIVQAIKSAATSRIRTLHGCKNLEVFEPGFNDKILHSGRNLQTIIDYIDSNPYRLAVRQANPDFFTRVNNLMIAGTKCSAYGNLQLIEHPFREQVHVHRIDSAEQFAKDKARWLYNAANNGVLVSPFISARERQVRTEAEQLGGRFILIKEQPFSEREKPSAHDFELCATGRMLIVAPSEGITFNRASCVLMNSLAEEIVNNSISPRE